METLVTASFLVGVVVVVPSVMAVVLISSFVHSQRRHNDFRQTCLLAGIAIVIWMVMTVMFAESALASLQRLFQRWTWMRWFITRSIVGLRLAYLRYLLLLR